MSGSEATDFLSQVSTLLGITCVAGLMWIGLMVIIMQRANERRRREHEGLEPLPGFYQPVLRWFRKTFNQERPAQPQAWRAPEQSDFPAPSPAALSSSMPVPDLHMLTGDDVPLDAPDEADDDYPEPAASDILGEEYDAGELDAPPAGYAAEDEDETFADEEPALEPADKGPAPAQSDDLPPPALDDFAAEPDTPEPSPPPAPAPDAEPPDSVELLRVWRDLADGTLIVEIGGQQFRALDELRGADLERRFRNVVRDLEAMPRRPAAPPPPDDIARATDSDTAGDEPPAGEADADDLSMAPGAMFRRMTRVAMGHTPTVPEHEPELSIAEQIERRLQARLETLDEYRARSIHVKPSLHGGVEIEVDGVFYAGVDAIEDDAVRALLQDVVREWEEEQ